MTYTVMFFKIAVVSFILFTTNLPCNGYNVSYL